MILGRWERTCFSILWHQAKPRSRKAVIHSTKVSQPYQGYLKAKAVGYGLSPLLHVLVLLPVGESSVMERLVPLCGIPEYLDELASKSKTLHRSQAVFSLSSGTATDVLQTHT